MESDLQLYINVKCRVVYSRSRCVWEASGGVSRVPLCLSKTLGDPIL